MIADLIPSAGDLVAVATWIGLVLFLFAVSCYGSYIQHREWLDSQRFIVPPFPEQQPHHVHTVEEPYDWQKDAGS